jgi:hypothetical protein
MTNFQAPSHPGPWTIKETMDFTGFSRETIRQRIKAGRYYIDQQTKLIDSESVQADLNTPHEHCPRPCIFDGIPISTRLYHGLKAQGLQTWDDVITYTEDIKKSHFARRTDTINFRYLCYFLHGCGTKSYEEIEEAIALYKQRRSPSISGTGPLALAL